MKSAVIRVRFFAKLRMTGREPGVMCLIPNNRALGFGADVGAL